MKGIPIIFLLLLMSISNGLTQGETCATAIPITALPFSFIGATCGSANDYFLDDANPNICDDVQQSDHIDNEDLVFEFTAPETDCYYIEIPAGSGGVNDGTSFHVFESCPDDPLNVVCLGWSFVREDPFLNVAAIGNVELVAGQTVYIVVSKRNGCTPNFMLNIISGSESTAVNDFCSNAIPLPTTGTNAGATNCGEPQEWTPFSYGANCTGSFWISNENGVWYTIEVTDDSPDPFSITILNVACTGGMVNLQMGLWEDVGDCTLSEATFIECAVGLGTVTIGPLSLPNGNYHLFIDGQSGSDCTWEFESEILCTVNEPTPESYGPYCSGDVLPNSLAATPDDPANVLTWYNGDPGSGGVEIGTGTSIPTPSYITNTPGSYEVWVTESVPGQACESNGVVIMIEVNETPTANLTGNGAICAGSGEVVDLFLELTGTGPWEILYSINGMTQSMISFATSPQVLTLSEGQIFELISVSAGGCDGTVSTDITIDFPNPPMASIIAPDPICNVSINGSVINFDTLVIGGAMNGSWTDTDGSGASGVLPILDFDGVAPNSYTFTYTTASAISPCLEVEYQIEILVEDCDCPSLELGSPPNLCNDNGQFDLEALQITAASGNWSIINFPTGANPATLTGSIFDATGADAGQYELSFTLANTVPDGCPTSTSIMIEVVPEANAGFDNSLTICNNLNNAVDLNTLLIGGSNNGLWSVSGIPIPAPGSFDVNTGLLTVGEVEPGEYNFEYFVSAADPCLDDTASFTITIEACDTSINKIFFPNVFSPNNDGINDFFLPFSPDLGEIEYFVYDRWGSNVFRGNDINQGWDGAFKGKLCNTGVYAFYSTVTFQNGETRLIKGSVTLIR